MSDNARNRTLLDGEKVTLTLPQPVMDAVRAEADRDYMTFGTMGRLLIVEALRARGQAL